MAISMNTTRWSRWTSGIGRILRPLRWPALTAANSASVWIYWTSSKYSVGLATKLSLSVVFIVVLCGMLWLAALLYLLISGVLRLIRLLEGRIARLYTVVLKKRASWDLAGIEVSSIPTPDLDENGEIDKHA